MAWLQRRDFSYHTGERTGIEKIKKQRTSDCVVGGFRYLEKKSWIRSLPLGLYNSEGKLDPVEFTSSIQDQDREALPRDSKA